MLKKVLEFEVEIEGKKARILFDDEMPIASAKEALFQAVKLVLLLEDNIKQQQEAEKAKPDIEPIQTGATEDAQQIEG